MAATIAGKQVGEMGFGLMSMVFGIVIIFEAQF
jgi:hypothetical protein